jgi:hypothetical protein
MLAPLHVHSPPTFLPSASFNSRCLGSYWICTTQALNQFFFINTLLVSLFDNDICWFVVLAFFFWLLFIILTICFVFCLFFNAFIYIFFEKKKKKNHALHTFGHSVNVIIVIWTFRWDINP